MNRDAQQIVERQQNKNKKKKGSALAQQPTPAAAPALDLAATLGNILKSTM